MNKVTMKAPNGSGGASFGGEFYEAKDGYVTVPVEAIADLQNHGFEIGAPAEAAPAAAETGKKGKKGADAPAEGAPAEAAPAAAETQG